MHQRRSFRLAFAPHLPLASLMSKQSARTFLWKVAQLCRVRHSVHVESMATEQGKVQQHGRRSTVDGIITDLMIRSKNPDAATPLPTYKIRFQCQRSLKGLVDRYKEIQTKCENGPARSCDASKSTTERGFFHRFNCSLTDGINSGEQDAV